MAAVEVIDLTTPPPHYASSSNNHQDRDVKDGSKKKRKKTRRKSEKDGEGPRELEHGEKGRERQDDAWKHDRYVDEDGPRQGRRRKRGKRDEPVGPGNSKKPQRSPSVIPVFTIDVIGSIGSTSGILGMPPSVAVVDNISKNDHAIVLQDRNGLLLPSHVSIAMKDIPLPSEAVDVNGPMSPASDASGIDFLDDSRTVGAPRYFQDATTPAKSVRACKRCGDEGHDEKHCPNTICFTCGARNEHSSRNCPILRFCFKCQGKGHLAKDCPRIGSSDRQHPGQDCERCGSYKHHGSNCPTLWRIYTYLTDTEREAVLADRESKRKLGFDNGGEGYIARDHWCYNCGHSGHLGDDCGDKAHNYDKPNEFSAFGTFNWLTGPFASSSLDIPRVDRQPRHWETGDRFDDGHGFSAENNVGRKGREKAKTKARETQRQIEADDDDEGNWFNANHGGGERGDGRPKQPSVQHLGLPHKPVIHVGLDRSRLLSFGQTRSNPPPKPLNSRLPPKPSLRDRIDTGDDQASSSASRDRDHRRGRDARDRELNGRRDDYKDRDRSKDRGSRWKGGYGRH